jgi:hypothetical protein
MSVDNPSAESEPSANTSAGPMLRKCANYMGCRHCEEGALVYDPDVGASRCRSCGRLD